MKVILSLIQCRTWQRKNALKKATFFNLHGRSSPGRHVNDALWIGRYSVPLLLDNPQSFTLFSLILCKNNTGGPGDKDKYVIFWKITATTLNAFKDELGKINWVEITWLKWSILHLWSLCREVYFSLWFFHSEKWKRNGSIFVSFVYLRSSKIREKEKHVI